MGVELAGLSTRVFPAARAGATLWATRLSGKLNGLIAAITPTGRRVQNTEVAFACRDRIQWDGLAVQPLGFFGCDGKVC